MTAPSSIQRIARLTPLSAILDLISARVGAVKPGRCTIAHGARLHAGRGCDGVAAAVDAHRVARRLRRRGRRDCRCRIPMRRCRFGAAPPRVDVGEMLPGGTDAVLPLDAVTLRGDRAEAIAAVAPGEGVLPAGGDAAARMPLRRAGERLRALDLALMTAAGIESAMMRAAARLSGLRQRHQIGVDRGRAGIPCSCWLVRRRRRCSTAPASRPGSMPR